MKILFNADMYTDLDGLFDYDRKYHNFGFINVAGVDEAGRGPLAGPVCASAVILPREFVIRGLNDSKKLSERKRAELFEIIMDRAAAVGVGLVSAEEIDGMGILPATRKSMTDAVTSLCVKPGLVLIDGLPIKGMELEAAVEYIVRGDSQSASIAAASIVAKVTRDNIMVEFAEEFPEYGFEKHKGYGTATHIAAIGKYGLCGIHRKYFIKDEWLRLDEERNHEERNHEERNRETHENYENHERHSGQHRVGACDRSGGPACFDKRKEY